MAVTGIVTCNTCDNFILPGDVVTFITKGILIGVNETGGTNVGETPDSPVLHYCEGCAQGLAADMRSAIESVTPQPEEEPEPEQEWVDYPYDEEDEEDDAPLAGSRPGHNISCTNSDACCPSCAKPDRCCQGLAKPENYLGFGVTKAEYLAAVRAIGLIHHADDVERTGDSCPADQCAFAPRIREELARRAG
jgi:hypothetical protein